MHAGVKIQNKLFFQVLKRYRDKARPDHMQLQCIFGILATLEKLDSKIVLCKRRHMIKWRKQVKAWDN
jgi:hypothetical protein